MSLFSITIKIDVDAPAGSSVNVGTSSKSQSTTDAVVNAPVEIKEVEQKVDSPVAEEKKTRTARKSKNTTQSMEEIRTGFLNRLAEMVSLDQEKAQEISDTYDLSKFSVWAVGETAGLTEEAIKARRQQSMGAFIKAVKENQRFKDSDLTKKIMEAMGATPHSVYFDPKVADEFLNNTLWHIVMDRDTPSLDENGKLELL